MKQTINKTTAIARTDVVAKPMINVCLGVDAQLEFVSLIYSNDNWNDKSFARLTVGALTRCGLYSFRFEHDSSLFNCLFLFRFSVHWTFRWSHTSAIGQRRIHAFFSFTSAETFELCDNQSDTIPPSRYPCDQRQSMQSIQNYYQFHCRHWIWISFDNSKWWN